MRSMKIEEVRFEEGKTYSNGWNKITVFNIRENIVKGMYYNVLDKTANVKFGENVYEVEIMTSHPKGIDVVTEFITMCGTRWYADNREEA